jgi:translation initiation factor IF-3
MDESKGIWDLEVFEIKITIGKDSLSYRLGQVIRKYTAGKETKREVTYIGRRIVESEIHYQVYTTCLENREDIQLEKVSINNPVYLTMKTRTDEDS